MKFIDHTNRLSVCNLSHEELNSMIWLKEKSSFIIAHPCLVVAEV